MGKKAWSVEPYVLSHLVPLKAFDLLRIEAEEDVVYNQRVQLYFIFLTLNFVETVKSLQFSTIKFEFWIHASKKDIEKQTWYKNPQGLSQVAKGGGSGPYHAKRSLVFK